MTKAVRLHQEGKGLSLRKAAEEAGTTLGKIRGAIRRGDSKITSGGRPPIADEECVKILDDTVTEDAVHLDAKVQRIRTAVKTVVAQQQSNNSFIDPDSVQISDKTVRRVAKRAGGDSDAGAVRDGHPRRPARRVPHGHQRVQDYEGEGHRFRQGCRALMPSMDSTSCVHFKMSRKFRILKNLFYQQRIILRASVQQDELVRVEYSF